MPFHDDNLHDPGGFLLTENDESSWRMAIVQGVPFDESEPHRKYAVPSCIRLSSDRLNMTGLCWHHDHCSGGDNASSRKPGFPSWSWAGWKGPIKWRIPKLCSPRKLRGMKIGTIFHLEDIGFIENLENSQELNFHEAKQAQQPLLCFSSIAFPPEAFFVVDPVKQADHIICLYEYIIAWPKEGCLCYSEGTTPHLALLKGLQQGTHKLVLLNVHVARWGKMEFQAWILRKCETGKSCYERIGSVYHEMERETRLGKYLEDLVKDAGLERFEIC
ncbi:hypothetical protein OCU04_004482 [Sclerotinia nivalis]|uniref:Uncharacterized protein n=1 Tax=Sclerotinia nivalis TaxID=352851 RepID=A0A9X0AQI6_9HELO|nr:hypothetical protein OCU04_004482 [Sclerotinia nivalis]